MATLTSDQTKLLQNAAAAYTNTGGNGLVQGQVDHTIQLGKRVKATVEENKYFKTESCLLSIQRN